jgi:hypothetical protein
VTVDLGRRPVPFGTILLLALAGALYIAMLATTSFSSGGGDAAFGQAMASLTITIGLWIVLAILVVVGGILGEMPRSAAIAAVFLLPLSGVATFVAIDMCSRHIKWAILFPAILPLLIALAAVWARIPPFRAAVSIRRMSLSLWSLVLLLSVVALVAASIL